MELFNYIKWGFSFTKKLKREKTEKYLKLFKSDYYCHFDFFQENYCESPIEAAAIIVIEYVYKKYHSERTDEEILDVLLAKYLLTKKMWPDYEYLLKAYEILNGKIENIMEHEMKILQRNIDQKIEQQNELTGGIK